MLLIDIGGEKNRIDLGTWKSLDVRPTAEYRIDLNTCKYFPVKDVDAYYTSQTLEHFTPDRIEKILKECYRTLKPGGKIRIVVPDIRMGIKWYLEESDKLFDKNAPTKPESYPDTLLGYLISWFVTPDKEKVNGHKTAFDWDTLSYYLLDAGFDAIFKKKYNECSDIFIGKDIERYKDFSLYVEVQK